MENYRLEGLKRFVEEDLVRWLSKKHGFLKADFEAIGAILFTKYQGEDDKFREMMENGNRVMIEAQEFLDKLKNK